MRIRKIYICALLVTFLIGNVPTLFLELREAETMSYPDYKMESAKTQFQTVAPVEQIKTEFKPKVFKVEGFWDGLENQHNKHILEIGEISNGEDLKVKSGETWLGFFGKNEKSYLLPTKIRVQRTDESDLSWKVISAKMNEKPLFLAKNLKSVKAGKVKTIFCGVNRQETAEGNNELTTLGKEFSRNFILGEKQYTLRVEEGISEKQEPILVLLLENGAESQIIHYIYYSGEGDHVGNLFWVGDLDSDGKLDLFMDFWGYEKGGYSSGLFLSSEAEKGKLVKLFEYFALSGC